MRADAEQGRIAIRIRGRNSATLALLVRENASNNLIVCTIDTTLAFAPALARDESRMIDAWLAAAYRTEI